MPEVTDPTAPAGEAGGAPAEGTAAAAAEDPTAKLIEDYRKRQAGAERARGEAERARDAALAELNTLKSAKPAEKGGEAGPDVAAQLADMQAKFDKRLADETARINGEALNARFPAARAKFPQVTDPVQLAELEGFLSEPESPTPVGNSPQRSGSTGQKNIEDMTSKELQAYMAGLPPEAAGLGKT